jgi:hypothetical protein
LYDTTNGYQLPKTNEGVCKLVSVVSSNTEINLYRTITFIQPHDNIFIIFGAPSNLYLSKLPAVDGLVTEESASVSFVRQSSDSGFSLKSIILKTIVKNNLGKTILILNKFDIYCTGPINSYGYLIGDPIVYAIIS